MLFVAMVGLLAAAGLLVVAVLTGQLALAWASIGVSAVAAGVLVVRVLRQRKARAGRHRVPAGQGAAPPPEEEDTEEDAAPDAGAATTPGPAKPGPVTRAKARSAQHEPAEEDTDAADLLIVCDLPDEVLVVDERPRYHAKGCHWIGSRPTEALSVHEARDLGFTPCAGCGPDAELARRHRAVSAG
ncbi:MAG: hypothetical protein ACRDT0_20335 [Pseudonocardiaceae bacterium]